MPAAVSVVDDVAVDELPLAEEQLPIAIGLASEVFMHQKQCIEAFCLDPPRLAVIPRLVTRCAFVEEPAVSCIPAVFDSMVDDFTDCVVAQIGTNANFSGDPGFCDAENGDLRLCADSPCLSGTLPNGQSHDLIGALGVGCGDCGPHVDSSPRTWGSVKAMYR